MRKIGYGCTKKGGVVLLSRRLHSGIGRRTLHKNGGRVRGWKREACEK